MSQKATQQSHLHKDRIRLQIHSTESLSRRVEGIAIAVIKRQNVQQRAKNEADIVPQ